MNKRPVGLTLFMVFNMMIGLNAFLLFICTAGYLIVVEQSAGLEDFHSLAYMFLLGLLCFVTADGFRIRLYYSGYVGGIALGVLILIHHVLRVVVWKAGWDFNLFLIIYALVLLGLLVFRYRHQFGVGGIDGISRELVYAEPDRDASDDSEPDTSMSARLRSRQRILIAVNLLLGAVLWLGYCTDYSLRGVFADVAFIIGVTLVASITFYRAGNLRDKSLRRLRRLACLPSLIGGGPFLLFLTMVIALFPVMGLGIIFFVGEVMGETVIQRALSPDGTRYANVCYQGVGAYSSARGRVFVRIVPRWMPVIEREVYAQLRSYADEDAVEYLHWIDNRTLRITGEPEERGGKVEDIEAGHVEFSVPVFITAPFALMYMTPMLETMDDVPPFDFKEHNAELIVLGDMVTAAMADDHLSAEELQEVAAHVKSMKDPMGKPGQFGEQGSVSAIIASILEDNIITPHEQRLVQMSLSFYDDNAPWKGDADP